MSKDTERTLEEYRKAMTEDAFNGPVYLPAKKGKRHWTVDRRTARRQSRDQKYWVGVE